LSKDLDTHLRQSMIVGAGAAGGYLVIFPIYLHVGLLSTLLSSLVILAGMVIHAMSPLTQLPKDDRKMIKMVIDVENSQN
ncbi:MAG: hypothetical protein VSS52_013345, partial [Thiotrichaceae bacterium]|nr:hypothetical protein [Thiotrichaceae bacterium]